MTIDKRPRLAACSAGSIFPFKVPDPHDSFRTAGNQPFPIRAERQICDSSIVSIDKEYRPTIPGVQEANPSVPRPGGEKLSARAIGDDIDPPVPVIR